MTLLESPPQIVAGVLVRPWLKVWIDESECERAAGREIMLQIYDQRVHVVARGMREHGVSHDHSKLHSEIGNGQAANAFRVERTVVTVVVNPVRRGKSLSTFCERLVEDVDAVIV